MDLESKKEKKNKVPSLEEFIKEDFFNPFDEEDLKPKKSKHISDKGGLLGIRKESYNPSRIEYVKKGINYVVQARTQFGAEETVEIAPVIILGAESTAIDGLRDIVFELNKGQYALVLGYGALYSHSDKPNLVYGFNKKTRQMHFITTRPIQVGEDLTINYGKDYWVAKKEFNMMGDHTKGDPAITRLEAKPIGDIEESEVQPGAADSTERNRTSKFMEKKANPARTGVAIKGTGQQ